MEDRREKFVRLANARVTKALQSIRLIGNLANKSNYSYATKDVEKMFRALNSELKTCRLRFEEGSSTSDNSFRLE